MIEFYVPAGTGFYLGHQLTGKLIGKVGIEHVKILERSNLRLRRQLEAFAGKNWCKGKTLPFGKNPLIISIAKLTGRCSSARSFASHKIQTWHGKDFSILGYVTCLGNHSDCKCDGIKTVFLALNNEFTFAISAGKK